MSIESLNQLAPWAGLAGNFVIGVWLYLERRNDKTNDRVTALIARVETMDRDLATLKQTALSAPSHADLAKVYESINTLAGTVNQMAGENKMQSDLLRLIFNQLTEKGLSK